MKRNAHVLFSCDKNQGCDKNCGLENKKGSKLKVMSSVMLQTHHLKRNIHDLPPFDKIIGNIKTKIQKKKKKGDNFIVMRSVMVLNQVLVAVALRTKHFDLAK